MAEGVERDRDGSVATVTINHPPANALSRAVVAALDRALDELAADPRVRALVLTGAGERFFVAGADIREFGTSAEETRGWIAAGQALTLRMTRSRLPIVAAVNGYALGGGLELAMACDIRVASATARLGQPEVNLGLIPGWGGTQRLPRLVGRGAALALLLGGDPVDANTAERIGLVHQVAPADQLRARAHEFAQRLAAQAPVAVAEIKRAVADGLDRPLEAGLAVELDGFMAAFASSDAAEGVAAFLAKRPPAWSGT
ncbi:MAG TPA: enoyl-CoA hydratase-related protein [Verrucomicrobiae bacterium]|nr:enoyl-CoA hydratase-related protein [Verrucomicrobiae bacterium]